MIDVKLGCLWYIELQLDALVELIEDKVLLVEFLMQRKNAKLILLRVLQSMVGTELPKRLMDMPSIFDKLNAVYRNHLENEIQSQVSKVNAKSDTKCSRLISVSGCRIAFSFLFLFSLSLLAHSYVTDGNAFAEYYKNFQQQQLSRRSLLQIVVGSERHVYSHFVQISGRYYRAENDCLGPSRIHEVTMNRNLRDEFVCWMRKINVYFEND